jgi:multidrug efflux pump subunit AcrA (membrane-fusion protein)
VRGTVRERQELLAPISGVISKSIAVPGQLANAREVIFEIVDPAKLWVEAIAYDARVANDIEAARVKVNDEQLSLKFVSRGLALRQQGTPLHFSIENPTEALSIGKSVTVIIQTRTKRAGMVLPQAAIVRTANGLHAVWTHTGAERFKSNVVRFQTLDGDRALIESGLEANARVVSEGAAILNQVR